MDSPHKGSSNAESESMSWCNYVPRPKLHTPLPSAGANPTPEPRQHSTGFLIRLHTHAQMRCSPDHPSWRRTGQVVTWHVFIELPGWWMGPRQQPCSTPGRCCEGCFIQSSRELLRNVAQTMLAYLTFTDEDARICNWISQCCYSSTVPCKLNNRTKDTWRNNNVIIMSKRRRTSRRLFDVIMTLLRRRMSPGIMGGYIIH